MAETVAHRWHPLEDYPQSPDSLASSGLRRLALVWNEQRHELTQLEALERFNERLRREWAIETGLIERVYTLDRGITQLLIERGIDAALIPHRHAGQDPNRVAAMIRDHETAIDGLFDFIRGNRRLTTSYIRELHALLTRNQQTITAIDAFGNVVEIELLHGEYKQRPNNPRRPNGAVHQYCPPEQVASEMDRLVALHHAHEDAAPEVEAAWLHHRFTQIHPFQDGNGRVARALATLVFIRAGWFPLVIRDLQAERTRYLDALAAADHGELGELVRAFSAAQKRAFLQALDVAGDLLRLKRAEQLIREARNDLARRVQTRREPWESTKTIAAGLLEVARSRFEQIAAKLAAETSELLPRVEFRSDAEPHGGPRDHFFRWQIAEMAKSYDYHPNLQAYRSWARLLISDVSRTEILVSFHAAGHEYRGVVAVSACYFRREQAEENEYQIVDLTPLARDLFLLTYLESKDEIRDRFREWLEEVLVNGLELWRTTL